MVSVSDYIDRMDSLEENGFRFYIADKDVYGFIIKSLAYELGQCGLTGNNATFFGIKKSGWQPALDICRELNCYPLSVEYHSKPLGSIPGVIELKPRKDTGFTPTTLYTPQDELLGVLPLEPIKPYKDQVLSKPNVVIIDDQTTAGRIATQITGEIKEIAPDISVYYVVLTRGIHFPTAKDLGVTEIISALIEDTYCFLEKSVAENLGIVPGNIYFGDPSLIGERSLKIARGKKMHEKTPKITYQSLLEPQNAI